MEVLTVQVTGDAKKLWSCENVQKNHPELADKKPLPTVTGKQIRIILPAILCEFCESKYKWNVCEEDSASTDTRKKRMTQVCEHQIDFLSEADRVKARRI